MYRAALASNAKRPDLGGMALCAAAAHHQRGTQQAPSPLHHDRIEGDITLPGKAPAR